MARSLSSSSMNARIAPAAAGDTCGGFMPADISGPLPRPGRRRGALFLRARLGPTVALATPFEGRRRGIGFFPTGFLRDRFGGARLVSLSSKSPLVLVISYFPYPMDMVERTSRSHGRPVGISKTTLCACAPKTETGTIPMCTGWQASFAK
jgi:hypothetical protein